MYQLIKLAIYFMLLWDIMAGIAEEENVLVDLVRHAGISLEDLDQQCSDDDLLKFSKLCDPWEEVGYHLRLKEPQINAIKEYIGTGLRRIKTLHKWKELYPGEATYKTLIKALLDCEKNDRALMVCKRIYDSKVSSVSQRVQLLSSELSPEQIRIKDTIYRLEEQLSCIQRQLARDTTLDELLTCISTTISVADRVYVHLKCCCSTVQDFFSKLKKYCRAICPDILQQLVKDLGDEDTKKEMEKFMQEYIAFRKVTKLKDLVGVYEGPADLPEYYRVLKINLGKSWDEKTLEDLERWRCRNTVLLWLLKSFFVGSLIVTYFVPVDDIPLLKHLSEDRNTLDDDDVIQIQIIDEEYIKGVPMVPTVLKSDVPFHPASPSIAQQLYEAVFHGDCEQMKSLLKDKSRSFDINTPYYDGKTLLIIAAERGNDLVILVLLDGGADIAFEQETTDRTALFFAAENGHEDATAILLAYGADPHHKDSADVTALDVATEKALKEFQPYISESAKQPAVTSISTGQKIVEMFGGVKDVMLGRVIQPIYMLTSDIIGAAKSGDAETMEYILVNAKAGDMNKLVNTREDDKYGWTSLMYASEKGNARIVELLLGRGANPNDQSKYNKWTCLMLASRRGALKVVMMLLDRGADPNPKQEDTEKLSALSIAISEGRTAVALLLIHRRADINFSDQKGWTPLMEASKHGNLKLVKVIADLGADLNQQNQDELSSLMVASNCGHSKVVKELANRGADLNLATSTGDAAIHIASQFNQSEVVKVLAEHRADLNARNKDGLTALMVAANKNYVDVADALLEGGADPNQPHQETEWTAVFFAAKNGHVEIVQILLFHNAKTEILNEDGSTKLSVLDVASHLKQMAILSALGTSVDYTPNLASRAAKDIENNVKIIDSFLRALERRFMSLKKALS